VFFAISQFSPNIDVLIFTYGIMGGQLPTLRLLFDFCRRHLSLSSLVLAENDERNPTERHRLAIQAL